MASSAANALAGTAVDITDVGIDGPHTLTPASITGGAYKIQVSADDVTYFDITAHDLLPVAANITVTANFYWDGLFPTFNYARVLFACTTGQFSYTVVGITKTEE